MQPIFNDIPFTHPETAFAAAIASGALSDKLEAANFAGRYMYMCDEVGQHLFKNRITREYLRVAMA
jgi:hypothetical protein